MTDGVHDLLEVHACACNGRVLDTLQSWWRADARCECDGEVVGEGPDAIRRALEKEWDEGLVGRIEEVDGGRVLVAYDGEFSQTARLMVRLETGNDRVTACRIDHIVE